MNRLTDSDHGFAHLPNLCHPGSPLLVGWLSRESVVRHHLDRGGRHGLPPTFLARPPLTRVSSFRPDHFNCETTGILALLDRSLRMPGSVADGVDENGDIGVGEEDAALHIHLLFLLLKEAAGQAFHYARCRPLSRSEVSLSSPLVGFGLMLSTQDLTPHHRSFKIRSFKRGEAVIW